MTFWCGSGSADPCLRLMDLDSESRCCLLFLRDDRRIRIRTRIHIHSSDLWIRIREAQKRVDPLDPDPNSDPDPQHCFYQIKTGDVILPHGWLKYPGHVVFINRIHLVDELGQEALPLIVKMKVRKTDK